MARSRLAEVLQAFVRASTAVMALFPTREAACGMTTVAEPRAWTGAPRAAVDAVEARVGLFEDKMRNLALLPGAVL